LERLARPPPALAGVGLVASVTWLPGQPLVEPSELLVAVVLDDDPSAFPRSGEADLGPERSAQVLLDPLEIGIRDASGRTGRFGLRFAEAPDEFLGLSDGQFLPDDRIEDSVLELGGQATQGAPVALGQTPIGDGRLDARCQIEQAKRVRHGGPGSPDPGRDLVLAEPELIDELPIRRGGLERVEILALEVLHERELELAAVRELSDDCRDALETGRLGRPKTALAGDELVAVDGLGDQDRL